MKLLVALLALAPLLSAGIEDAPELAYKLVPHWAQLPAGVHFGECTGVDVDRDGSVWVFNRGSHPVLHFDKTGKFIEAWKDLPIAAAHGLRVDPEGNVWLVDVAGHAVLKMSRQGRVLLVIAQDGRKSGDNESKYAFNRPSSLTIAPGGDFFVSDGYVNSRVVHYSKDGEYIKHWGSKGSGDGQFDLVHDIARDKNGRLYVADRVNSRVQIFDADGKFLGKWTHVGQPWGLAYSASEDALYLCDGLNNRVVKVGTDGKIAGKFGSFGKAPGRFDFAHHIAVDGEGSLYVAEIKNWRVQKFVRR
ncbi:MAG TPA: hypothetical protein DEH78_19270 [Solibacterales bacterium]|nr:hypothetical protein [Bryobacterales bacterium]